MWTVLDRTFRVAVVSSILAMGIWWFDQSWTLERMRYYEEAGKPYQTDRWTMEFKEECQTKMNSMALMEASDLRITRGVHAEVVLHPVAPMVRVDQATEFPSEVIIYRCRGKRWFEEHMP